MKINCSYFKNILLLHLLLLFALSANAQMRIQGNIVDENGAPVIDANIKTTASDLSVGSTDAYGFFSIIANSSSTLKISCVGYETIEVAIKGRQKLALVMKNKAEQIEEIVVAAERITIIPEPTEIEIRGNYFDLKTRIPVPKKAFKGNTRLIVQPIIYNVTKKKTLYMNPIVFDGKEYTTTQKRMYNFDLTKDPLHKFIKTKTTKSSKSDVLFYHDSLYVEYPHDIYRADTYVSVEHYNYIAREDTFTIARGTVNPLRLLEYNFDARKISEKKYIPRPEMQLRDTKGEAKLTFIVGRTDIDDKNPTNTEQINQLRHDLKNIEQDIDATLQSFHIVAVSSPEGRYLHNKNLAKRRAQKASKLILSELNKGTRNSLKITSESDVEKWETVVELMKADTLTAEVEKLETLLKTKNKNYLDYKIRRLPFYKKIIEKKYLPQLRKVKYNYTYSILRYLTDDEIVELYHKDYKKLTRFEFYRMLEQPNVDKEKICRQALEQYPNFLYAANELALLLLEKKQPDRTILARFINKKSPNAVIYNQALTLLTENLYQKADSVLRLKYYEEEYFKDIRPFIKALNGRFRECYKEISATSPINEVVMLLAMKSNKVAYEKAKKLKDSAIAFYLRAVAANRLEDFMASTFLEMALQLDPSLIELARTDGDIIDLLPDEQQQKVTIEEEK